MKNVNDILMGYNGNCRPLKFIKIGEKENIQRFNMVTDSIASHSLLGGVATALILSTLLCNKNNWRLRIITRTTECNPMDYYNFLKFQEMDSPGAGVEFVSDIKWKGHETSRIELTKNDIFMATSWWSAKALLESDYIAHIFYIIQEEETFFYPYGDLHLWCKEIMNDDRIDYIINSKLLYDYLREAGYSTLIKHGMYFEPAFPKHIYYANKDSFKSKETYKLFFYGRPNNPRNLFYHGLEIIQKAIQEHILDTDMWEIYMAGGTCEPFYFLKIDNGKEKEYTPVFKGQMTWEEYAEFARNIDVAICLMYTPHPSYPPFDLLSSGAVVLTNEFANKRKLSYSSNLIMSDLNIDKMLDGLRKAVKLAKNMKERKENYSNNNIETDWINSVGSVIKRVSEIVEGRGYV